MRIWGFGLSGLRGDCRWVLISVVDLQHENRMEEKM